MVSWDIGFELSKKRHGYVHYINSVESFDRLFSLTIYSKISQLRFYYIKQREEDDIVD